jgi:mono/diheme cytochrome c family protein
MRRIPPAVNVLLLVVAATAFYTYVGQLVPQKEVHPPEDIVISADLTADELIPIGEQIANGKGLCLTCHTIQETDAQRYPHLAGIGSRAATRIEGMNDIEYMAQSMYEPDVYLVEGFSPGMPPMNKPPIGLSDEEILSVIAWLQSMGGTPSVTLETTHAYRPGE